MMFRGTFFRLFSYGIIAGVAIIMASQILGSVSWVVVSMRLGNVMPFLAVVGVTLVMQRVVSLYNPKSPIIETLLDVTAWGTVVYLFFVLLVGLLPYGLLISLAGAGFSVLGCMIVRDPTELKERLHLAADLAVAFRSNGLRTGLDYDLAMWAFITRQKLDVLLLPRGSFGKVVSVLRDRPLLPAILSHFEFIDVLIIREKGGIGLSQQVKKVLADAGVSEIEQTSPLLRKAVLLMPLLDVHDGLEMSDYVLAVNEKSVEVLLKQQPERLMIFPHPDGLRAVTRRESVPGIEAKDIPSEFLERIILGRDLGTISLMLSQAGGEQAAN
ncbi:MAG: hypothetical protein ACFFD3_04535 [Candidatus Thorarchaeota archaeon]